LFAVAGADEQHPIFDPEVHQLKEKPEKRKLQKTKENKENAVNRVVIRQAYHNETR
jgi:hypothetical protein